MKQLVILFVVITAMGCQQNQTNKQQENANTNVAEVKATTLNSEKMSEERPSLYDNNFKLKTIEGEDFNLSSLKGKRLLIVNTASFCGYTGQYEQLQELHDAHGSDEFAIMGLPANNFGGQEPHDNATIKDFCSKNFGVEFLMMEKISVAGSDIHPLYKWLTSKDQNGVKDAPVKWNFQKFLIDPEGRFVEVYSSGTNPLGEQILAFAKG